MLVLFLAFSTFLRRFVKMPAFCSVVGMRSTLILPVWKVSWRKWYLMSIHLRLRAALLFCAIWAAAVLSKCSVGWCVGIVVSRIMLASHSVSVAVSAAAIYYASQVLFATMGCCRASHCPGAPFTSACEELSEGLIIGVIGIRVRFDGEVDELAAGHEYALCECGVRVLYQSLGWLTVPVCGPFES